MTAPSKSLSLRISMTAIAFLTIGIALQCQVDGGESQETKTVLLLYSHQTNAPVNADWDRGIRRSLAAGFPDGVRFETEYLDLGREDDTEYYGHLVDLLQQKYADSKIDVVIPIFAQAFLFAINHRDLFHNAPVVFCSVPQAVAEQAERLEDLTGVVFAWELVETVQLARDLFPDGKQLLVVSGSRRWEESLRQTAERTLSQLDDELDIQYLTGVPLAELSSRLETADQHSIVLILSHDADIAGRTNTTVEAVTKICQNANAPVFCHYDTPLGHGILGGKMASAEAQGALAGELAVRVLKGESASEIPVTGANSNRYMFDARQLRRWDISEDKLPSGSVVRFREVTFWDQYGAYLVALLVTILVQSLVIAALVFNRSRRIRAEQSLRSSRSKARVLAGQLISAQEDERKRLARELHDDLSQRLAASAIMAGKLEQGSGAAIESQQSLARLRQDLISISDDVHRISRQIHPAILEDLGLAEAIRSECDRLTECNEIPVSFRCGELPSQLPNSQALCLYRIAQEALWNAFKHSQATEIHLILTSDDEAVFLEIRDDGIGFDLPTSNGRASLGLASMSERARLAGGTLEIVSQPSQGTVIAASIPVPEPVQ